MEAFQGFRRCACFKQGVDPLAVAATRTHRADVRQVQSKGAFEQGDIELGVVGQDAHHGAGVDASCSGFGFQVAVRPLGDHLVCS
ncbi:hypothetical protein D3C73_1590810 [compost metagenome]